MKRLHSAARGLLELITARGDRMVAKVCGLGVLLALGFTVAVGQDAVGSKLVMPLGALYFGIAVLGARLMYLARPEADQTETKGGAEEKKAYEWCWPTHLQTTEVCERFLWIAAFALVVGFFIPLNLAAGSAQTTDEVAKTWCNKFCQCSGHAKADPQKRVNWSTYFCDEQPPPRGVPWIFPTAPAKCKCLEANPWIMLTGLDGNPQQFLYTTVLVLLAALLAFFSPRRPKEKKETVGIEIWSLQVAGLACILFASMRWLRVYRLMPYTLARRVLFSYANHDISLYGTLFNDLTFLIIAYMIVLIWARWLRYATWLKLYVEPISPNPWAADGDPSIADYVDDTFKRLTHAYAHWKLTSLFVGLAFGYMTVIYWNIIWVIGDRNYLASAVAVHALWAITWIIVSIPVMRAWRSWRSLVEELAIRRQDKMHGIASALHPVGMWGLIGLSLSGLAAFVTPFVQAWSKHG